MKENVKPLINALKAARDNGNSEALDKAILNLEKELDAPEPAPSGGIKQPPSDMRKDKPD